MEGENGKQREALIGKVKARTQMEREEDIKTLRLFAKDIEKCIILYAYTNLHMCVYVCLK